MTNNPHRIRWGLFVSRLAPRAERLHRRLQAERIIGERVFDMELFLGRIVDAVDHAELFEFTELVGQYFTTDVGDGALNLRETAWTVLKRTVHLRPPFTADDVERLVDGERGRHVQFASLSGSYFNVRTFFLASLKVSYRYPSN